MRFPGPIALSIPATAAAISLYLCQSHPVSAEAGDQTYVDAEIVLAVDVSSSMDAQEHAIQRNGYAAAIRHPEFIHAAMAGPHGSIAITYVEWAGYRDQALVAPWTIIGSAAAAHEFALTLETQPIHKFALGTSISAAISMGAASIEANAIIGTKRVIDISGDGPNNSGDTVEAVRDEIVARGIVINGLPVMIRPSTIYPEMDLYYLDCVVGGAGAFVLPVFSAAEFPAAIRRKLILEMATLSLMPKVQRAQARGAQARAPVDCLVGEKARVEWVERFLPGIDW